jgi:hypothetical protein
MTAACRPCVNRVAACTALARGHRLPRNRPISRNLTSQRAIQPPSIRETRPPVRGPCCRACAAATQPGMKERNSRRSKQRSRSCGRASPDEAGAGERDLVHSRQVPEHELVLGRRSSTLRDPASEPLQFDARQGGRLVDADEGSCRVHSTSPTAEGDAGCSRLPSSQAVELYREFNDRE